MFRLPGMTGRGWGDSHRGGHGWTDARKSIYESVNTYYYQLALDMGVQRFDEYMAKYGFGQKTGIDLLGEIEGIVPSPESKRKYAKERWYPGDLVNSAIGQGLWKATPLQLARGTAAIANGGLMRRPHLATEQRAGFDAPWQPLPQPAPLRISDRAGPRARGPGRHGNDRHASAPRPACSAARPTVRPARPAPRRWSTAARSRSTRNRCRCGKRHRALFIGYAPAESPTIAVAVMVEGGGYGASTAAPIARKVFDAWLLGKMPRRHPARRDGPGWHPAGAGRACRRRHRRLPARTRAGPGQQPGRQCPAARP